MTELTALKEKIQSFTTAYGLDYAKTIKQLLDNHVKFLAEQEKPTIEKKEKPKLLKIEETKPVETPKIEEVKNDTEKQEN